MFQSQLIQTGFVFALFILVSFAKTRHKVIFSEDYSLHERPPTEDGKPLVIEASINLRNILDVAEKEQIISLETTLRLYWKVRRRMCTFSFQHLLKYILKLYTVLSWPVYMHANNNITGITFVFIRMSALSQKKSSWTAKTLLGHT